MNEDEKKSGIHIHTGGLILLIIILLILFKVDIISKVQSPQFQKNITFITTQAKNIWENDILKPIKDRLLNVVVDVGNNGLQKVQDNISKNLLKQPTEEDINKIINN